MEIKSLDELKKKLGEKFVLGNKEYMFIEESGELALKETEVKVEKKGIEADLKEANIKRVKEARDGSLEIGMIHLLEDSFDEVTGEVEAILIEAGTNHGKKRHYPISCIEEAAPHFRGLKMYLNHQTDIEERNQPERNIKDWASTIVESRYEDGKAIGRIAVHDTWLRERLKDPVARGHIGLSINAGGRISEGSVNGSRGYQIVEKIIPQRPNGLPASVDWVTEAGARGRVSRLLKESVKPTGGNKMELHEASVEDIKKENPALYKSLAEDIKESVVKEIKESDEQKEKEAELKEAREIKEKYELKEKQDAQADKVDEWLKEAKAPDVVKERVAKSLARDLHEDEDKLEEAFKNSLKEELDYVSKFSSKGKINIGGGDADEGGSLMESMEKELAERAGVVEKEQKESDD